LTGYADASFLTSIYVIDRNSQVAAETLQSVSADIIVSEFAWTETINAIYQFCFRNAIRRSEADRASSTFAADIQAGIMFLRELPASTYLLSRSISSQWTPDFGTRTGDVIHLAACLELKCDALFSFDRRQRALAEKLSVKCLPQL